MDKIHPVLSVFNKYGLALYDDVFTNEPVDTLDDDFIFKKFSQYILLENPNEGTYSRQNYKRDLFAYIYSREFTCRIQDADRWLSHYNLEHTELPITKESLNLLTVLFPEPYDSDTGGFLFDDVFIDEIAKRTNKKRSELYSVFSPEYSVVKLFSEVEAAVAVKNQTSAVVNRLDKLTDYQQLIPLKNELLAATLDVLSDFLLRKKEELCTLAHSS